MLYVRKTLKQVIDQNNNNQYTMKFQWGKHDDKQIITTYLYAIKENLHVHIFVVKGRLIS